ncbi:MAG: M20/M25/M40 family metallo-hydrolase [Synergistales bacterium]|nr:M20/M25/M40 family metallo-hydrolase [Synergistales bacterium]
MWRQVAETAYPLLLDLVSIPSVSPSGKEENRIAAFIRDRIAQEGYFREHPEDLRLLSCPHDALGRHCVFAMVRSTHETPRTVLLTGHMDVVDTDVYGPLRDLAFSPEELTKEIGKLDLSDQVRSDLESGEWLFGRGVADMKCGVAVELAYLMAAAKDPAALQANVAVLIVPDEENNSGGMLCAVPHLRRFRDEEGLRFLTCINTEPTVGTAETAGPTIYRGSIGKINPFFFCLGRETHVGEYYQGLSAAPIVSYINLMLDGNTKYADQFNDIAYPPYGCLKQHDLRDEYSASIMTRAAAFYSYLTVTKLPGQILEEMRGIAWEALQHTLERHKAFSGRFASMRGMEAAEPEWNPKVLSYGELKKEAEKEQGISVASIAAEIAEHSAGQLDEREMALRLVERLVDGCDLRGPLVVLGFLPPFYPHRANTGRSAADRQLDQVVDTLVTYAEQDTATAVETMDFFEGVSDLSYCGFQAGMQALEPLADNLPGWGRYYSFPVDDLVALDIPIVNIGPVGRDAHKVSERLHVPYAMEVLPRLLDKAVHLISEQVAR